MIYFSADYLTTEDTRPLGRQKVEFSYIFKTNDWNEL